MQNENLVIAWPWRPWVQSAKRMVLFRLIIHDGTHGVGVNQAIVVRDQLRTPTAGDLQTVLQVLPGAWFGLTGDVARAHRFGIGSAAYYWSRLMAGIGRAAFYMLSQSELFMLVYVDDLLWITRDKNGH